MRTSTLTLLLLAACGGDNSLGVYNTPPNVSIVSPPDGTTVDEGQVIGFEAAVADDFDADKDLQVRWSSTVNGEFDGLFTVESGFARFETANLDPGNHDITILVTDTKGETASDTIQVVVNDLPEAPEIQIVRPLDSSDSVLEGEEFEAFEDSNDESKPEEVSGESGEVVTAAA